MEKRIERIKQWIIREFEDTETQKTQFETKMAIVLSWLVRVSLSMLFIALLIILTVMFTVPI